MNDFPHLMCPICFELAVPVLSFSGCMHKVCKACAIRLGWNENSTRVMTCPTCQQISRLRKDHAVTQTIEDLLRTTPTPDVVPDAQRSDAASMIVSPPLASQPSVDLHALHRLIPVMENQANRFAEEANRYEVELLRLEVEVSRGLLEHGASTTEFLRLVAEKLRSRAEGWEAPLDVADLGAMASHLGRYCGRAADEIRAVRDAINTGINAMRVEREEHRSQRDLEQAQRAAARGRLLAARREAADRGDAPSTDARPQ